MDGPMWLLQVRKESHFTVGVVLTSAVLRGYSQTPKPAYPIGLPNQGRVGNKHGHRTKVQLQVEIMVGHVHAVLRLLVRQARRALLSAGERPIRRGEGRLPDLGELVHQPRDGGFVGVVVHEEEGALARED